jgi:serine/threonine-protein kinase
MDDAQDPETPGAPRRKPDVPDGLPGGLPSGLPDGQDTGHVDGWLIDHLLGLRPPQRARFVARLRESDAPLADRAERHAHVMGVFEALDAQGATGDGSGADSPTLAFARMLEGRAESVVADLTDQSPLGPGDSVGVYRVVRELGRGGMGVVYLAERDDLGLQVALKLLAEPFAPERTSDTAPAHSHSRARDIERFYAEQRALARIVHPGVPQVHDAGWTEDGRPYLVMELALGEPVTEYARRQGLGVAGAVELFLQLCAAVQHVHGRGLAHGDIKPENVLVRDGEPGAPVVKLVDFGVAAPLWRDGPGHSAASVPLTPAYAAPERQGGVPPSVRSDVYALGLVLGELVRGAVQTERGDRSSGHLSPLLAVLARATESDPAERYGSVREFAAEVREAACDVAWASLPVAKAEAGRTEAPNEAAWRWTWAAPAAAFALTLGVIAVLHRVR